MSCVDQLLSSTPCHCSPPVLHSQSHMLAAPLPQLRWTARPEGSANLSRTDPGCLLLPQASADDKFADYKPTTAFFFPGQGAQSVGMAKASYSWRPHLACHHSRHSKRSLHQPAAAAARVERPPCWLQLPCVLTLPVPPPLSPHLLLSLQDLVAECPAAKELFDKAADILGYDLLKVNRKGGRWADVCTQHTVA